MPDFFPLVLGCFLCQVTGQSPASPSLADSLLGGKSQTLAVWLYTIATFVLVGFVVYQVKKLKEQIKQVENQLVEARASRDLESFVAFTELWEDPEVRSARRLIYKYFGSALRTSDEIVRNRIFEDEIGNTLNNQERRQLIELVINKSNQVGLLWSEGLFSERMRAVVLPYIYKTVIQTWLCLKPYIEHVRKQRREQAVATITYAAPFESLYSRADSLRKERNEPEPVPAEV